MRRFLFGLCFVLLVLVGAVVVGHGHAVQWAASRALEKAATRLGQPLAVTRVTPLGLYAVRLEGVRVGLPEAPLAVIDEVVVHLDPARLRRAEPRPVLLEVRGPTLFISGDGTDLGALRALQALKDLVPRRAAETPETEVVATEAETARRLPETVVTGARLIDRRGGLETRAGDVKLHPDLSFEVEFEAVHPGAGKCHAEGNPQRVAVECDTPLTRELAGGLSVSAGGLIYERVPVARVQVKEARVRLPPRLLEGDGPIARFGRTLDGLAFSGTAPLKPDANGQRPIEAVLALPGGGRIAAQGVLTGPANGLPTAAELATEVSNLDIGPLHHAVQGKVSGRVKLLADLAANRFEATGDVQFSELIVEDSSLAETAVGPTDFGFGGELVVTWSREAPELPRKFSVSLQNGRVGVGDLEVRVSAEGTAGDAPPRIRAEIKTGRVDAARIATAFPPGLLPHLEPVRFRGAGGISLRTALDLAHPEATELEVNVDVNDLRLASLNPDIDFHRLRRVFRTRFEMPDGRIIERTTGPDTERWVPLQDIPTLLPAAVVAQEDGGFYRHRGVSLLHLRGSLTRNLERGRFARGGSTLTMQLARNLFLNHKKTLSRKLEEFVLAWLLEDAFSKDQLIEMYLNIVEFGEDVFGIREAASHYFTKTPDELTPAEIGFIVRLLPAPRRFGKQLEKKTLSESYARRIDRLLALLVERGALTAEERAASNPRMLWHEPDTPPTAPETADPSGQGPIDPFDDLEEP